MLEDRVDFKLGTVVKHKKYNFRGIIAGWDAYPRTNVSNWDGLQDVKGEVNNMPFFHVVADTNDTLQAFGQERKYRYVCQENLELCLDDGERRDIDIDLDEGWTVETIDGVLNYVAPNELKYQHAEMVDTNTDDIISECMDLLLFNLSEALQMMKCQINESSMDTKLTLDSLFKLLANTESLEDAYIVEEFIKEIWKVHVNSDIRWTLEDGTEALLRGDKVKAMNIFDDIIERKDPNYVEAFNKKATCHYMIGEMRKSIEAAEKTCEMEPRHFQAYAGLGLVYNDITQYDKAVKSFRRSLRLQPWSPVSSRLSLCLDLMKRLELQEIDTNEK